MQFPLVLPLGVSPAWAGYRTCLDYTFGPFVDCRFDFTLFFEQLVFSSLPSLLLILFTPWVIASLRFETKKTVPYPVYAAKIVRLLVLTKLAPRYLSCPVSRDFISHTSTGSFMAMDAK